MDENAHPVQGKDFISQHPTYCSRNVSQVQHTSKSLQNQLRPLQRKLCLSLVILFFPEGPQEILMSHFIYPSNYRQHYSFISGMLQTALNKPLNRVVLLFPSTLFPFCLPRTTGIRPGSSLPSVHGTPSFHLSLGICPFSCHSKFFIPKMKQTPIKSPLSLVPEK